jgi:osmotically-inducible protein OsmY
VEANLTTIEVEPIGMATIMARRSFPMFSPHGTVFAADEELRVQIERALAATGYPQLRKIGVDVRDCKVALNGFVPTYYLKQVAQCAALSVRDGCVSANDIEVTCGR